MRTAGRRPDSMRRMRSACVVRAHRSKPSDQAGKKVTAKSVAVLRKRRDVVVFILCLVDWITREAILKSLMNAIYAAYSRQFAEFGCKLRHSGRRPHAGMPAPPFRTTPADLEQTALYDIIDGSPNRAAFTSRRPDRNVGNWAVDDDARVQAEALLTVRGYCVVRRGKGTAALAPPPSSPPPFKPPPRSGLVFLDEAEHFLHNRSASVAPMVFGIIPECRSDSFRNMRSAPPESPSDHFAHIMPRPRRRISCATPARRRYFESALRSAPDPERRETIPDIS